LPYICVFLRIVHRVNTYDAYLHQSYIAAHGSAGSSSAHYTDCWFIISSTVDRLHRQIVSLMLTQ